MSTKIAIIGPYIYHNFGDDLIGMVIAKHLIANKFEPIIPNLETENCNWLNIEHIIDKKRAILDSSVLIIGGGGILGNAGLKPDDIYRKMALKSAILAKVLLKKVIITGIGAGPLSTKKSKKLTKLICRLSKVIGVRDIESEIFLKSLNINESKIIRGADIALLWPAYLKIEDRVRKNIGIQFDPQNYSEYTENPVAHNIKERISQLAKSNNTTLLINGNYDSFLHNENKSATQLKYKSMKEFLAGLSGLKVIVTTHLHIAIAAYALRIPCFSIYVREKTKRFYNQIGHPERAIDMKTATIADINKLCESITNVSWTIFDEKKLTQLKKEAKSILKLVENY